MNLNLLIKYQIKRFFQPAAGEIFKKLTRFCTKIVQNFQKFTKKIKKNKKLAFFAKKIKKNKNEKKNK